MKPELKDLLCEYLGELMHDNENTFDWIKKDELVNKINAVNVLLGIKEVKESTMSKVIKFLKNDK